MCKGAVCQWGIFLKTNFVNKQLIIGVYLIGRTRLCESIKLVHFSDISPQMCEQLDNGPCPNHGHLQGTFLLVCSS